MKLGKANRFLKEMPWIRKFFVDGEVFLRSSVHEKQFVTYLKRQLKYISIRPFSSLDLSSTPDHRYLRGDSESSRSYNYAILWHCPNEAPHSRLTWVGEAQSVKEMMVVLADAGESIFDTVVKEMKTTVAGALQDSFQVFKVPEYFSAHDSTLLDLPDEDEDEDEDEGFF